MAKKLNSMRVLEQHKIPYEVLTYDPITRDAEEVAEMLGLPYFMVYKTLVVEAVDRPDIKKPYLAIIPSDHQLNMKKMALAAGIKKVRLAAHKDAERLTGLQVGGISALALTAKTWPIFLDNSAAEIQHIVVSAGQRGIQLRVPVVPLVNMFRVQIADVSDPHG